MFIDAELWDVKPYLVIDFIVFDVDEESELLPWFPSFEDVEIEVVMDSKSETPCIVPGE
jgi:hypothetical protein